MAHHPCAVLCAPGECANGGNTTNGEEGGGDDSQSVCFPVQNIGSSIVDTENSARYGQSVPVVRRIKQPAELGREWRSRRKDIRLLFMCEGQQIPHANGEAGSFVRAIEPIPSQCKYKFCCAIRASEARKRPRTSSTLSASPSPTKAIKRGGGEGGD